MTMEKFWSQLFIYFKENNGKIVGGLLGFFFGILFLVIGFFKTLLLLICTFMGYYIGSRWNIEGDLKKLLNKILPPGLR
jgi:uncharacterized membrane protein